MAKYLSNRQKNLRIGISSYTESNTVLEITGKVGIGTTNAQQQSLYVVGDGYFSGGLRVSGVATFGNNTVIIDGDNNIVKVGTAITLSSIDGITTPQLNISGTLTAQNINVSGASTLASNGGITTTGGDLYVGKDAYISQNFVASGIATVNSLNIGAAQVISSARQLQNIASLDATTTATIESAISNTPNDFTSLNVTGISTLGVTSATNLTSQQLNVSGVSTFAGITTVTGTTLFAKQLNVSGVSTLAGKIVSGNGIGNTNLANTLNYSASTGITAFRPISLVDSAAGIKISRTGGQTLGAALELQTWDVGIVTNYSYWDVNAQSGYFGIRDVKNSRSRIFIDDSGSILLGATSSNFTTNYNQLVGVGTDKLLNVLGNSYISGSVGIGTTNSTSKLSVVGDGNFTGVVTATTFIGNLTGIAASSTQLVTPRTFEITGDVVASAISFDGTGNVSLAATIQPNSVALGGDTTGDYVQSISGTSNQITVTGGTGEGSTPTLSIPNQFTVPQDLTVLRDVQINRNLNVTGNITIGGTTAFINVQELKVTDADLILGFRTDAFGNDASTDTTANHGGIAVASTEGNPLVNLTITGIETTPATYKKIMWFKAGSFAGLGTDAWLINYAVGIGSTQFPAGTRLAAGSVQFTERDLAVVRDINASGIITSTGLTVNGNVSINNGTGNVLNLNNGTITGVHNIEISDPGPNEGIQWLTGNGWRIYEAPDTLTNTAGNLQFNVGSGRLFTMRTDGSLSVPGIVTATSFIGGISSFTSLNVSGITTTNSLNIGATQVISSARQLQNIASLDAVTTSTIESAISNAPNDFTSLNVSGISTLGVTSATNLTAQQLNVSGLSTFSGITTHTTSLFGTTASFIGIVTASSFSGNASSATYATTAGIATYATTAGIATYATSAGVSTSVIGGIASVTQLNVSGITTLGITSATNLTAQQLNVSGISTFTNTLNVVPTSTSIAGLFSGTTSSDMVRITQLGTGNALVVEDEANPDASPFVVTGVGTVGIGITNPSIKLTVNGGLDSSNRQVRFVNSGTGDLYIKHANLVSSIEAGSSVQLALGGNGAEVVRINSTGVGVGTTNPQDTLDVGLGTIRLYNKSSPTRFSQIYQDGALNFKNSVIGDDFIFYGASNLLMRLNGSGELVVGSSNLTGTASQRLQVTGGAYVSGSVGIGTTNPQSTLHLQSAAPTLRFTETDAAVNHQQWMMLANNQELYWQAQTDAYVGGGNIFKMTRSNEQIQTFEGQNSGVTWFTINNNTQRVGIGTTNPSSTLDVRATGATIRVQNPAASNYSVLLDANTGGPRISLGQNGDNVFVDFGAYSGTNNLDTKARNLRIFSTAAPNAFTLQQSTGNIGINSTSPTSVLDVVGDGKFTGVVTATTFSGQINAGVGTITTLSGTTATYTTGNITNISGTNLNYTGISTITNLSVTNINSIGIITATQFTTGSGNLGFTTNTISGPSEIIIDPLPVGVGTTSGVVRIRGDLYVDGTQFIVNSTTIELADFNVGIATTVGTNALLDGAGIGIGSTNIRKTITWNNGLSALSSSENWNIFAGKTYKIGGTDVLSSTTLGTNIVNSSLTSVGTLGQLNVSGVTTSSGGFVGNLTGTATTATNLADAANITTGTIAAARLSGTYNININGSATYATSAGIATYAPNAGIATYATSAGIATYATTAGVSTNVIGGIASVTQLSVSGISTLGITSATNLTAQQLNVSGLSTFSNNINIASGIITTTGSGGVGIGSYLRLKPYLSEGGEVAFDYINGNIGYILDVNAGNVLRFANYDTTGVFTFVTNSTEKLRITNAGSVGIGSASPTSRLDVVGDGKFTGVVTATTFSGQINAGVSTLGIATATNLISQQLNISGITTSPTYDTVSTRTGSATSTTTTTSQTAIHTGLSTSSYRSVEYLVQAVQSTNFHTTKILVVHDGTTAYLTEYGTVFNNATVASYDVDISGGNLRLLATPASSSSTTFKINFTTIVV